MNQSIRRAVALICVAVPVFLMTACGSEGSIGESAEQFKEKAEEKYNEIAEKLVDPETDSLDIQDGYFIGEGEYVVVIKNNSEDKVLSKFSLNFDAYDADGNLIEPDGFPPNDTVGPLFPGESAVSWSWGADSWVEEPYDMGYSIKSATWGGSGKHVAVTDIAENYYGNYTVTISNLGNEDVDLQKDFENYNFEVYAIFRDSEGTVTGVSSALFEEFVNYDEEGKPHGEFPVLPAESEITTSAEAFEVYPGTAEIAIVWKKLM